MSWEVREWTVIERAKEELEILESQHPNRFHYLKLDLKAFISDFESHSHHLLLNNTSTSTTCPSAITQESSNRQKRKKGGSVKIPEHHHHIHGAGATAVEASRLKVDDEEGCFMKRRGKTTDAILERANQCLHKIQLFKTSFYP